MVEKSLSKSFAEALCNLKDSCINCWAHEYSDIFPQSLNSWIANKELRRNGNPPCICEGKARLAFINRVGDN